jgi:hypothetical protein
MSQRPRWLWLDSGITALLCLAYLIFVTGDYFLPSLKNWLVAGFLLAGFGLAIFRFYLTLNLSLRPFYRLLQNYGWLGLALAGGAFLRWQAIRVAGEPSQAWREFANSAYKVLLDSNWQSSSLTPPPLYLYLGAVVVAITFLQQASAGRTDALEALDLTPFLSLMPYIHFGLGLVAIVLLYLCGAKLFGQRGGAVTAIIGGTAWANYALVAQPAYQNLAVPAVLLAFYLLMRLREGENGKARLVASGLSIGIATGAGYAAVLLLPLALWFSRKRFWWLFGGFGLGSSLAFVGWLFSLNKLLAAVVAVGRAPENSLIGYFSKFWQFDAGLVAGLGLVMVAYVLGGFNRKLSLVLLLPLLYLPFLLLVAAESSARFAMVAPFIALAIGGAVERLAQAVQNKLNDGKHAWAGTAFAIGVTVLLILVSVGVRRFN